MFFQAAEEMGWPYNADFNGERQEGIGRFHVTQVNGERCSAARAFLHPALARPNLTVLSSALTCACCWKVPAPPAWRSARLARSCNCRHAAK